MHKRYLVINSVFLQVMNNSVLEKALTLASEYIMTSYAPYSKFHVCCILTTNDSQQFIGTNLECSSYGLCICAERSALVKAIQATPLTKKRKVVDVFVVATKTNINDNSIDGKINIEWEEVWPCGACRQLLIEHAEMDICTVHTIKKHQHGCCINIVESEKVLLKELLPKIFSLSMQ